MSHVVHPALQVSSRSWFQMVVGGTNMSSSVRPMGLVLFFFFSHLSVVLLRCDLLCVSLVRGWLSSSLGLAAAVWMYVCHPWHGTASALGEGITQALTSCLVPCQHCCVLVT